MFQALVAYCTVYINYHRMNESWIVLPGSSMGTMSGHFVQLSGVVISVSECKHKHVIRSDQAQWTDFHNQALYFLISNHNITLNFESVSQQCGAWFHIRLVCLICVFDMCFVLSWPTYQPVFLEMMCLFYIVIYFNISPTTIPQSTSLSSLSATWFMDQDVAFWVRLFFQKGTILFFWKNNIFWPWTQEWRYGCMPLMVATFRQRSLSCGAVQSKINPK